MFLLKSMTKLEDLTVWIQSWKSLWGLGTEEEEGYRTGLPGYIGWRNSFLGIDSGAPYTFKNTGSGKLGKIQSIIGALVPKHVYS